MCGHAGRIIGNNPADAVFIYDEDNLSYGSPLSVSLPLQPGEFYADEVMKDVIGQFGMGITVSRVDDSRFRTIVDVCISPAFFAWVFQREGKVLIEGPTNVVDRFKAMLGLFV